MRERHGRREGGLRAAGGPCGLPEAVEEVGGVFFCSGGDGDAEELRDGAGGTPRVPHGRGPWLAEGGRTPLPGWLGTTTKLWSGQRAPRWRAPGGGRGRRRSGRPQAARPRCWRPEIAVGAGRVWIQTLQACRSTLLLTSMLSRGRGGGQGIESEGGSARTPAPWVRRPGRRPPSGG